MAEQTVREQLAEALEQNYSLLSTAREILRNHDSEVRFTRNAFGAMQMARRALDRARAEPQTHHREDLLVALDELFQEAYFGVSEKRWEAAEAAFKAAQSELSCPDICDTSCRCYQEGLEAQRERVG